MAAYLGYQPNYYDYRLTSISCAACYSYNYTAWSYWLLQSEILTALNVCGQAGFRSSLTFDMCCLSVIQTWPFRR